MKHIYAFTVIILFGCNSKSVMKNRTNTFIYDDKVEITLPDQWFLESSIINDKDTNKVGEFLPGLITPFQELTFDEIYRLSKNGGEIKAKETSFSYDDYQSKIIKVDSIRLKNYKWYCILKQSPYEGATENDYGVWNCYNFIAKTKDKVLFVTFYDKDINKDRFEYFVKIINTIKIK